jgi:hypothetical protein
MNEHLRERIVRKLDALSDERGYQILDFVEFLESKYAERQAPGQSAFTKFADAVEDRMRAGRVSAQTISETMGLLNRAVGILNGVAAAGRSMAEDLIGTTPTTGSTPSAGAGPTGGTAASSGQGTPPASAAGGTGGSTPPAGTPPSSAQGDGAEASTSQGGPRP